MFSAPLIDIHEEKGILEVRVRYSRLDASVAERFKTACAAVWRPETEELAINLGEVDFVDSTGIGALLSLYRKLPKENAHPIRLRHVQRGVRSVIELLRLQAIFSMEG